MAELYYSDTYTKSDLVPKTLLEKTQKLMYAAYLAGEEDTTISTSLNTIAEAFSEEGKVLYLRIDAEDLKKILKDRLAIDLADEEALLYIQALAKLDLSKEISDLVWSAHTAVREKSVEYNIELLIEKVPEQDREMVLDLLENYCKDSLDTYNELTRILALYYTNKEEEPKL